MAAKEISRRDFIKGIAAGATHAFTQCFAHHYRKPVFFDHFRIVI